MFKGFQNFFFGFIGLVFREELKVVISQVLLYSDLHAQYIYIYIYIYIYRLWGNANFFLH